MKIFEKMRIRGRRNPRMTESLAEFDSRLDAISNGGIFPSHVYVSDIAALNLATVFNAATIRTQYVAMLPLITYFRNARGEKEKFKGSPVYGLLHDRPNPLMTSYSWRSTMELHAIFYGGGFSWIEKDVLKRPIALWLKDGRRMEPALRDNGRSLIWRYKEMNGTYTEYPDADILHIPGLAFDGITGEGIIKLAAKSFWLSSATEEFGQKFFENGLNAGGVLQHPQALSDQAYERLKKDLNEKQAGVSNSHKFLILEEGMTWNKITFSPEEAQFLGTRQFQDVEVARWFNLPLRALKMADASGLRNVEQIAIEMVQGTFLPRYVAWEQEINTKLFGIGASRFAEFNVDGLLRGDSKTRADVSHIMRTDGIINADEWRIRENMNPIGGEKGLEYWGQPNLASDKTNTEDMQEDNQEIEENDNPEGDDNAEE